MNDTPLQTVAADMDLDVHRRLSQLERWRAAWREEDGALAGHMVPAESCGDGHDKGRVPVVEQVAAEARARQTAETLFAPDGTRPTPPADDTFRYGDGTAVDPANDTERQAFEQYRQAHCRVPASKAHSRAYYQKQLAAAQTEA